MWKLIMISPKAGELAKGGVETGTQDRRCRPTCFFPYAMPAPPFLASGTTVISHFVKTTVSPLIAQLPLFSDANLRS